MSTEPENIVIVGGGIVGLLLGLSLKEQLGVTPVICEAQNGICHGSGAGLILYPNGLRVIRDFNNGLLQQIREAGHTFRDERWERHDGSVGMAAHDGELLTKDNMDISSFGIRRGTLQRILYDAVVKAGIPVHFDKSVTSVEQVNDTLVKVIFRDGNTMLAKALVGADGVESQVRKLLWTNEEAKTEFAGITAIMGLASVSADDLQDLVFLSCNGKSQSQAIYFPTSTKEACFQLFFHGQDEIPSEKDSPWVNHAMSSEDLDEVAEQMRADGWHERYLQPLKSANEGCKLSWRALGQPLPSWAKGRVVLIGDAAHPPEPHTGHQLGIEDVGVFTTLLKMFCSNDDDSSILELSGWKKVTKLFQEIRMRRTSHYSNISQSFGELAEYEKDSEEMMIRGEILLYGSTGTMISNSDLDYKEDVRLATTKTDSVDPAKCLAALEDLMGMSDTDILMSPTSKVLGWNRKPRVSSEQAKLALESLHGLMG